MSIEAFADTAVLTERSGDARATGEVAGVIVSISHRVHQSTSTLAIEMSQRDARWHGKRLLELGGGCESGHSVIGLPDAAHVFPMGAMSCWCGTARR